jgi:chromosome segregation ATPase
MFEFRSLEVVHWDYWQRFELPLDGAIVTVVGPNGSGKTTLLDALRTVLAIEDRDTARDYKLYLRHNGEPFAWLRAVVSNRPDRRGGRPFFPIKDEHVTLFCRIRKKGGEWIRDYRIAAGDVPVEQAEQSGGEWMGVRDYRVRLAGAGLTRAICRVLTLEQGATDKLCQYSPRELLQLVFDVFEDKAVLDDYQRARNEQFDVEREIVQLRQDLAALHTRLEAARGDVRSFEQGRALKQELQRLQIEILPKLELAEQRSEAINARGALLGARRGLFDRVAQFEAAQARRDAAAQAVEDLQARLQRDRDDESQAQTTFLQARDRARDIEQLVKRHDELLRLDADRGAIDADALATRVETARTRHAELRFEDERERKRGGEIAAELAVLDGGKLPVAQDEDAFRKALDRADIAHRALTELVEIRDPDWAVAVEAVLRPYRQLIVLEHPKDARAAWALGERMEYRHFVVADRAPVGKATKGSLLEVVRFAAEPPAWLPRQLDKIRRVADIEAGAALPAGQDWITRKGYLREHRGGRHIGGGPQVFGAGARVARTQALRAEQATLAQRAQARAEEVQSLLQRLAADEARLRGLDGAQELVTRAAEFADAQARFPALQQSAQEAAVAFAQAKARLQATQDDDKHADTALATARNDAERLQRELQDARSQIDQQRKQLARRILDFRTKRAQMPAPWRSAAALKAARDKYDTLRVVHKQIELIQQQLDRDQYIEDESCVALRDKIAADHDGLADTLTRRDTHLERAKRITEEARGAYINVLRATVRRYRKNLVALGELAGIGVDADMPELANDDVALAQAGLSVRFDFDRKGWIGLDDGEASGGQQVMKSLLLLVALLRDEDHPGGFVFIDEPFAHLDVFNIEKVGRFLRATDAQYILTTPITHNLNVYEPSDLVLATSKRRPGGKWAEPIAVLKREWEATAAAS